MAAQDHKDYTFLRALPLVSVHWIATSSISLHSGMRRSEIARVHPCDVDPKKRLIFLKNTKNGESRAVPLSPAALETAGRCLQRSELMGYKTLFGLN